MIGRRRDPGDVRARRRLWLVFVGLRTRWDFHYTGVIGRKRYYGSWSGLAFGVVGLLFTPIQFSLGLIIAVASLLLTVALLAPEWTGRRRGTITLKDVAAVPFQDVLPTDGLVLRAHPVSNSLISNQWMASDDRLDIALQSTEARCVWTRKRAHITSKTAKYTYDILSDAGAKRTLFNSKLARQDEDLTVDQLRHQDPPVTFSTTDYYSVLCSNYMTERQINAKDGNHRLLYGLDLIVDPPSRRLLRLADNALANAVGVSTLAFTSDHKLVLIEQARKAQSSGGLYAPAGSGSLDYQDRGMVQRDGCRLSDFIAHGMRRELCEEVNLSPSELGTTHVLGYFRWLNKGAKPEYVGVTGLGVSARALADRSIRLAETRYVMSRDLDCSIDFELLAVDPDGLMYLQPEYRELVSVPLYMAFRALGRALHRRGPLRAELRRVVGLS